MSNGAEPRGSMPPGGANPSYRVIRELGKRVQRSWAAVREKNELVVVQRFTKVLRPASASFDETAYDKSGAAYVAPDAMAIILRDARCLSKNWHPNVSRVRHVDLAGDDLTIATELVEGVTLADLVIAARAKRANEKDPVLAFPLLARVIVDVLGGLHGLHGLRDGMNAPLSVFHGELCPSNIIIGKDGVARVTHVFRPRPVKVEARSEGLGYASPETIKAEANQDARADIYSVGAMLWEGLTGRRLFEDDDPARIAQRQREEDLEPPSVASSSAFARLSEVAVRALSFDPALRFRTASEMATEIRRIAGTRLAPGSAVAQTVMELAGDRIRARRAELDQSASGARRAFGAASIPPPTASPKKLLEADTKPKEPPKRDTQIIDDDGEKTQVDEPSPLTTRAGSDPVIAAPPAAKPAPSP
jgi:serine/threonine protein kinase